MGTRHWVQGGGMEQVDQHDLVQIKNLLRHTGEFVAYFELAESKMMEWRADIEEQRQRLTRELALLNETVSAAGVGHFRKTSEHLLAQWELHLDSIKNDIQQRMQQSHEETHRLEHFTQQGMAQIEHYVTKSLVKITQELSQYDVAQFHRVAHESCDHVARLAQATVSKSNKILGLFQVRHGVLALLTTLVTVFLVVLYLNDELPWEQHHQAMNERKAGKVLLNAWPKLSKEIRAKILNDSHYNDG